LGKIFCQLIIIVKPQ